MNLRIIIREEINKSDEDIIGKELWFEYHCWESPESCDAELWYRSHQKVTVLNRGIDDNDEYSEEPKVYDVIFKDGFKGTVFADELMNQPQKFYRPNPPNRIIKEEMDDFNWMQDVKSNQDIAQEIADKTELKNNRIYSPFFPSIYIPDFPPTFFPFPSPSLAPLFFTYCEEQYGLSEDDIDDVWERYKNIIKVLNSNINRFRLKESDLDWVDEEEFIKVGNCFLLFTTNSNINIKVTEIEMPTNIETWSDIQLKNRINVIFKYRKVLFQIKYSAVEQMLDKGDMIPIDCE